MLWLLACFGTGLPTLLKLAIGEAVELYTSTLLLDELTRTIAYSKFVARIERFGVTRDSLIAE